MNEQQPELRWAPMTPQPKKSGKVWLIVGLAVAALVIVGALLFFLLPREEASRSAESASPTLTATPTRTPSPTLTPTAMPEPTRTPQVTRPPVTDPTVDVFRGQVSGWLGDAPRGLDIIAGASGQDALPVIDTLRQDAQRLSDALPPSSIAASWRDGVTAYADRLEELRSAITKETGVSPAVEAARSAVQELRTVVGL